jgi:hypothetical protein
VKVIHDLLNGLHARMNVVAQRFLKEMWIAQSKNIIEKSTLW